MLAQLSLRRAPLLGARLAPSLPVPCHAAAYTTAPPTSAAAVRGGAGTRPLAPRRTAAAAIRSALPVHAFSACRAASTSTSPSPLPAAAARPAPGGASTLSWNEFLNLRRARRRWSLVSSTITAAGFVVVGTGLGLDRGWDGIVASTIGLDPLVTMILCVAALAASGWLLGPAVGGTVHRYWYRHLQGQMAVKDRQFYDRIRRYRGDPSSSSINNPIPDYYGEKIGSVAAYRKWLKDQRAYKLKTGRYGKDGEL